MNDKINAFVPHTPPLIKGKENGPLSGLTFAVKDLYDIKNYKTGAGSPDWLETHGSAQQTSPIVQALLDAGADIVGKTICDELFYSFTGANAHYGTPINSRAPDRMPGGSSSGSAAAVAAGLCDFALGSDTGGSVRVPASFCGLYGLRPTHGRIDLAHAVAMAPSFDTAGWFTRDARLFREIGGFLLDENAKPHDIETVVMANFAFAHADQEISGPLDAFLKQAKPSFPGQDDLDDIPDGLDLDVALECFRIIQGFEVWQNFGSWVEKENPNLGPGIKERIAVAKDISTHEKSEAEKVRNKITEIMRGIALPGRIICLPSTASLPPLLDAGSDELDAFRRKTMKLICLAGLAGLPQISIPASSFEGIPVGLSFIGWPGGDEALLGFASKLAPFCTPPLN